MVSNDAVLLAKKAHIIVRPTSYPFSMGVSSISYVLISVADIKRIE